MTPEERQTMQDLAMIAKNAIDRIIELEKQRQPVCWYHPVSGRVRWDNPGLGPSWIPLYKA